MDNEELKNILDLHKQWLANPDTGKRANLRSANLSYADLSNAKLYIGNIRVVPAD